MKSSFILSVAAGRSSTGFAVFCGERLEYYGILSLGKFTSASSIQKAVDRFFIKIGRKFIINELAIRRLNSSQLRSNFLPVVREQFVILGIRSHLKIYAFDGKTVNSFITGYPIKPTNQTTTLYLIRQFPELARFNDPRIPSRPIYYQNLFKAVAVGYVRAKERYKETKHIHETPQFEQNNHRSGRS